MRQIFGGGIARTGINHAGHEDREGIHCLVISSIIQLRVNNDTKHMDPGVVVLRIARIELKHGADHLLFYFVSFVAKFGR